MHTSTTGVLNIGADVAKDAVVVACSQGSFPGRNLANKRTALLAFPKAYLQAAFFYSAFLK